MEAKTLSEMTARLTYLEKELEKARAAVADEEKQLGEAKKQLAESKAYVKQLEGELKELKPKIAARERRRGK